MLFKKERNYIFLYFLNLINKAKGKNTHDRNEKSTKKVNYIIKVKFSK